MAHKTNEKLNKTKSHSKEDVDKMKQKEQLEEAPVVAEEVVEETPKSAEVVDVPVDKEVDTTPVDDVPKESEVVKPADKPVEEIIEETAVEAPPVEEPKAVEEPVDDVPIDEPAVKDPDVIPAEEKEKVVEEIKETKEELSMLKMARDELVSLYAEHKGLKESVERLSIESEELKKNNTLMAEQLSKFIEAETELKIRMKVERLSRLSEKFTLLGQDKSVEYLAERDEEIVEEMENIVDAALEKVGDMSEAPSVVTPSQGTPVESEVKSEEEKPPVVEKPKDEEKLSDKNFFGGLAKVLTKEQLGADKRVISL